ncbi:MAG TPA: hypothetical protein VMF10_16370 [Candidatus Aquilonibacter sp.]|nr:hypothetical protein [Candidatus Aquilonibacter sp.]
MSEWIRITIGFVVSAVGGHVVTWPLVEKYLWPKIDPDYEGGAFFEFKGLTWLTGIVERTLYTAAFYFGGVALEWVGIWLGIKVIARWQREQARSREDTSQNGEPQKRGGQKGEPKQTDYDVWLIGSAVSLACAFVGAWLALGHVPCFK